MPHQVTREGGSFVQLLTQEPDEQAAFELILTRLSTIESYFEGSNSTYFPRDGSLAASANWDMGGFKLGNLGDPVVATDAANRGWVLSTLAAGYQPLDPDLTALGVLGGVGLTVRTSANTWATRSFVSNHAAIVVTNPLGVAGNITVDLNAAALTSVGTVTTGVWNATLIGHAYGGTGVATTPGHGQLLIGNGLGYSVAAVTAGAGVTVTNGAGSITVANSGVLSVTGTANQVVASAATGAITLSLPQDIAAASAPTFAQVSISNAPTLAGHVTTKSWVESLVQSSYTEGSGIDITAGVVSLNAGTNALALNGLGVGLSAVTAAGTMASRSLAAGSSKVTVTNANGVAGNPTIDIVEANLSLNSISGTLGINKGGTGQTTAGAAFDALSPLTTRGDLIYGGLAGTASRLALGANGYVLMSNGTDPFWTQASSIQVTTAVNLGSGAAGSVPYQTGAGATSFLGLGTTNHVLTAGAIAPQWTNPNTLSVASATNVLGGVAGALVYQSNTNATAMLTLGAPGQVLLVGSGVPQWSSASGLSVGSSTHISGGAAGSVPYQTGAGATSFLGLGTTNHVLTAGASAPQWTAQNTLSVASATNVLGGNTNQLVYQTATNTTGFVPGGASSVLVTSAGGVPSFSTTLPSGLSIADSRRSVATGLSATGTTSGDALALTADYNVVSTVAAGTGVILATASAGRSTVVVNRGANTLKVYPAAGAALDGLAANAPLSLPAGAQVEARASSALQWYSTLDSVLGNLLGGAAGSLPYQSAINTTTMLSLGTTNYILTAGASAPQWSNPTGITVGVASSATALAAGATGSLPYQTGAGATSFLGLGTTNHVLTAGASAPQWTNPSGITAGSATNVAGGSGGQILYQSGSGVTAKLAAGTDGHVLFFGPVGAPQWQSPTTLTAGKATNVAGGAAGQILYQSGVDATSKLTLGTTNHLLTAGASAPQWSDPSSVTVGLSTSIASGAAGELLYQSASGVTAKLAVGTNTHLLALSAGLPAWTNPTGITVGTATHISGGAAGSLPYQTGAGATSTLALGTTNHILTAGASAPQWSNPTGITVGVATNASNLLVGATNTIPYQTGAGVTGFVTSANNAVLVTSGAGVPSLSSTLPPGITLPESKGSVAIGITAAGVDAATATALTADINVVSTAAAGTGVKLPAVPTGRSVTVVNRGANALLVYPDTGAVVDGLGATVGLSIPSNSWILFDGSSATQWYSTYNLAIAGVSSANNVSGGAANQIVYQTGADTTGFVTAAASSVLVSSAGNVPSWSTSLPADLTSPGLRSSSSVAVSAAGSTQGTATALTADLNVVTTVAAGAGVVLQTAAAGKTVRVINKGANPLKVYPASGAAVDALGANVSITIPVDGQVNFDGSSATQWYSSANDYTYHLANGASGSLPYQTGAGATSMLALGSTGYVLTAGASAPQWSAQNTLSVATAVNLGAGAANQIVYQTGAGTTGYLAAAANSVLVTNGSNVPSLATTLPSGLTIPGLKQSATTGITAAGTTQGTATALTADYNGVGNVTAGTGVRLASAVAGLEQTVVNRGANTLLVYPATGEAIDGLAVNAPFSLVTGSALSVKALSTGQWYSNTSQVASSLVTGTMTPTQGGTGLSTITTVGELYYGNNTTNMGRIAPVAAGSILVSNGSAAPPVWSNTPTVTSLSASSWMLAPVVYGSISAAGTITIRANSADTTSGHVIFGDTMDASSSSTGAARFAGGVGVAKALHVGTLFSAPGIGNDVNSNLFGGGGSLTTASTNGFVYVPSVAGTPSGVPTANAGRVPLVWDSSGVKIWAYSGGTWTGVGGGGVTLTDDVATNTTYYPTFATATSGSATGLKTSSTNLTYNPSTGALGAITFTSLSDERLKSDIEPISSPGSLVDRLNGVRFVLNYTGQESLGFIAQEVQEVLPELVSDRGDGFLTVAYGPVVAVLAASLKEERAKVKGLQDDMAALKAQVQELLSRG
jgi:hypothetical protein